MKFKYLFFIIIFILLTMCNVQAKETNYPDANSYSYPEHEVKIIEGLKASISSLTHTNEMLNFLLNYDFDLQNNKDKFYVIEVICLLSDIPISPSESPDGSPFALSNDAVTTFINANENLKKYDGISVWKKIITWLFLKSSKSESKNWRIRRHKLLLNIIENSKEFAPLVSYLLVFNDTFYKWPSEHGKRDFEIIQGLIDQFPNSEFAAQASVELANVYFGKENSEKAIQLCQNAIYKFSNFYTGTCDLYTKAYTYLAYIYSKQNNTEKVIFFIEHANKNAPNYEQIKNELLGIR